MIRAGILLAAGRSTRFGAADKLTANLGGRPLVSHAARALRLTAPDILIAVTTSSAVSGILPHYRIVHPVGDVPTQSDSLKAGVAAAAQAGADLALIVLADMPLVTPELLMDVIMVAERVGAAATTDGTRRMPPACFTAKWFPRLFGISGDAGARSLLSELPREALVAANPAILADVDREADLQAIVRNMGEPRWQEDPRPPD